MGIKIVSDSTSYIPEEMIKKYDISIASLSVVFKKESYREVDIDNLTFYGKMSSDKEIPTSSQPNINELYNIFEECVLQNHSIVGIFISSEMSGTYSTAHLVKEMVMQKYPQAVIELVDSRSNCMQLGFAVLAAAKAASDGKTMSEVLDATNNIIGKSRFLFVPDTLEYLKRGGRIGGAAALFGTILQIKPILTVKDGKTTIFDKVRTKKRALQRIIDTLIEDINEKGLGEVAVMDIDCKEEATEFARKIEAIVNVPVNVYPIGPVIGLHVGPGTLSVVYYTKE